MKNKLYAAIAGIALSAVATGALADGHASALSDKSWDEIVAQAQEEGELTWYVWYFQDRFRSTVKAFEDEYGIKVTIPEGTGDGNASKLLAERDRETGDIDVFAWGFNDYDTVERSDFFTPLDMLPEDDGRVADLLGVEGGGYVLAYWGNQTGIAYDPAKVSEDALPQTPEEFAAFWQENPGKFGFNYEKGGSGPSYYTNMLRVVADLDLTNGEVTDARLEDANPGIEFFNTYAEDFVVTASNVDSITRLSDGELWIVPAWEDHLAGLQNIGEVRKDIKFYIPEMGMNGGGNGVAIPKNAPHPAAAAVFINWLTSAETQTMFNQTFGTAPMHANADDSAALVPNEQRVYQTQWAVKPYRDELEKKFIEEVILER